MPDLPNTNLRQKVLSHGSDGSDALPLLTDAAGALQVAVSGSALPAGAATETKQDNTITALGLLGTEVTLALVKTAVETAAVTIGVDGAAAPSSAQVIAGVDGSNVVQTLRVDNLGNLQVDIASVVPAVGISYKAQLTNDAGAQVELTGLTANGQYRLLRLHAVHSAGTAANFQPRLYNTTGAAAGGIADIRNSASTLVANPVDDTFAEPIPFTADAAGKIYLATGVDAGADNTIDYEALIAAGWTC